MRKAALTSLLVTDRVVCNQSLFTSFRNSQKMVRTDTNSLTGEFSRKSFSRITSENGSETSDVSKSSKMESSSLDNYASVIRDLNRLQSNSQVVALAKYKNPEKILPLFTQQLNLAGIHVSDLDKLNIIHVSGTKGKGSTCAFTESILRSANLKTGFYNSPHLVKVTERIRINGTPIDDRKFSQYFRHIFDRLVEGTKNEGITMPSYFSFLTILAFHIFLEEKVDCAVIEVGIGGDYDPTNVIRRPIACGITTLDFDHTNILGNTIECIAKSKAGIIKEGSHVFTIEHEQPEALRVIEDKARAKNCSLHICKPIVSESDKQLGIQSRAQFINASLACQLARHLLVETKPANFALSKVSSDENLLATRLEQFPQFFAYGLETCYWPGRCQIVEYSKLTFFLDGAHTRKSMENCVDWFLSSSGKLDQMARKILMVNVIGERNKSEVLRPLTHYENFDHVIFSTNRINAAGDTPKSETFVNIQGPSNEKSMENVRNNANIWLKLIEDRDQSKKNNVVIVPNTSDGIQMINNLSKFHSEDRYHILVTGSLHFVGAILETLSVVLKPA